MKLIIHRGTHEIGGSCVELSSGKTRILLDFGMPLVDGDRDTRFDEKAMEGKTVKELRQAGILPEIKGLYEGEEKGIDGIFISHSHLDHYGFLRYINPGIPVYMSEGTKALLEISNIFLKKQLTGLNIRVLEAWKACRAGDFKLTPYLADHSAFDAFAYLAESKGKRVFYSGDFRGTGRKKVLFENIIKKPPKNIDCMLMEGSLAAGGRHVYGEETDVEERIVKILEEASNITFLFASGQNIDRLVSGYKACRRAGKLFVIDLYAAMVLQEAGKISKSIPQYDWENVRVFYFWSHAGSLADSGMRDFLYKVRPSKIEEFELAQKKDNILMLGRDNSELRKLMKRLKPLKGAKVIYSMWEGYLEEKFKSYCKSGGISIEKVHSSGHASRNDLVKFAQALNPRILLPIHTFEPECFPELYDSVKMLRDGEMYEV